MTTYLHVRFILMPVRPKGARAKQMAKCNVLMAAKPLVEVIGDYHPLSHARTRGLRCEWLAPAHRTSTPFQSFFSPLCFPNYCTICLGRRAGNNSAKCCNPEPRDPSRWMVRRQPKVRMPLYLPTNHGHLPKTRRPMAKPSSSSSSRQPWTSIVQQRGAAEPRAHSQ